MAARTDSTPLVSLSNSLLVSLLPSPVCSVTRHVSSCEYRTFTLERFSRTHRPAFVLFVIWVYSHYWNISAVEVTEYNLSKAWCFKELSVKRSCDCYQLLHMFKDHAETSQIFDRLFNIWNIVACIRVSVIIETRGPQGKCKPVLRCRTPKVDLMMR